MTLPYDFAWGILALLCIIVIVESYVVYVMVHAESRSINTPPPPHMVNTSRAYMLNLLSAHVQVPASGITFDNIYVIALPCRKEYIGMALGTFGIRKVTYVEPIMKDTLDKSWIEKEGLVSARARGYNRPENFGRIACHLSHLKTLELFLSDPSLQTALIFEDDIKPCNNRKLFENRIHSLKRELGQVCEWDVIYLGHCHTRCLETKAKSQQLFETNTSKCRHAYVVTRAGAVKILEDTLPMWNNGDVMMMKMSATERLTSLAVLPSLFVQNREVLGSTLGNDRFKVCHDTDELDIETIGNIDPSCPIHIFTRFSICDKSYTGLRVTKREDYESFLFSRERLDYKFTCFEKVTVPSVFAQQHTNWHWIIYISTKLPLAYRIRLESTLGHRDNIYIVAVESMRECVNHRKAYLTPRLGNSYITIRLDDDDGLQSAFLSRLTQYRSFYGSIISFPNGREYTVDENGGIVLGKTVSNKNNAQGLAAVNMDILQCGNHTKVNEAYNVVYDHADEAYMIACSPIYTDTCRLFRV
jgi:GR25 family glycosyltransferase involved in LPS biosynthesis